jgi:pimeloyl-ACP methyl ester carboxylesterase
MTTRSTALTAPKAADGEPALKYVQANGLRFAYLEQGSGPLVMFMHGFPDNAWSYRMQMQAFADAGYRAVSPFLRGYAPTEIPADGIFDPIALGKDLEALIAALSDDGQACVVGMDWGGTSTFQALATAPSTIKAAVVMNTAHPVAILSNRKDPEFIRSIFHVFFFQMPGADALVNIEGLPFVDYLWKLWSPTFKNDEHLRFDQGDAQLSRYHDGSAQILWRPERCGTYGPAADERDAYSDADNLWQHRSDGEVLGSD